MAKASKRALTQRQRRFIEEYPLDLNGAQAAIRAGYSKRSARKIAHENLTKPDIVGPIMKALNERSHRAARSAEDVIKELEAIGFANGRDYMKWGEDGLTLRDSSELTREQTAAVSEVTHSETKDSKRVVLRLHDKGAALRDLRKHHNLLNGVNDDDKTVTVQVNIGIDRRKGPEVEPEEAGR